MIFLLLPVFGLPQEGDAGSNGKQPRKESEISAEATRRDSVVVTGQYEPVPLEESARPVNVWKIADYRLLSSSIADYLELDPSVDLRQRAPGAVQSDLSIRGSSFAQTLVLMNGFRLNDPQTAHHNMDLPMPFQALEQIEVLRGTGSTLYGSDAIGGVVNFITSPPETTEFRLRGAVGNHGINQQSGSIGLVHKKFSELLSFSRDFSSGFIPGRDYRNLSFGSSTSWQSPLGRSNLTLAYTDRPFGADQFYCNCNSWERTKGWFSGASQELGSNTTASFGYRRHTDLFVLYRDRPEVSTNRHISDSYQAALRRRHELGPNLRVYYGGEGYGDSVRSNNLGNHSRVRGAVYAALDARALRRYSFSVAFREEVFRNLQGELVPNFGFGAWLSSFLKLRANASRGFRLPNFTELYYQDPASLGNPSLRPESAWSYEAGLDWFSGNRLRGAVTVFHRRESNGIDWVRPPSADRYLATNFQSLRFTGVEASVSARLRSGQQLRAAWTGIHGSQKLDPGVLSRYISNYPSESVSLDWSGALPHGLTGRSRLAVLQRFQRDAYVLWDCYLARSQGSVRPFLQLTNLTNTSYQQVAGVPMPGRGIVAGVELFVAPLR